MEKCAIIINNLAGNSMFVDESCLNDVFGTGCETDVIRIDEGTVLGDLVHYAKVVVCGGDGTLSNVINCNLAPNVQLFYLPYGTLNEIQHNTDGAQPQFSEMGQAGSRYFTYVCAAGIFTPLGYIVSPTKKKRWKKLAYFSKILKEYKIHRIKAKLELNGETFEDEYSLLMAIDSPQCFGCKFNKMFKQDDGLLHFLAIKAPKHNGLFSKIKLFFPLYRSFFIGYKRPYRSRNVLFEPVSSVSVTLQNQVPFDMDGEKINMDGQFDIKIVKRDYDIRIVTHSQLAQMRQEQLAKERKERKKNAKKAKKAQKHSKTKK